MKKIIFYRYENRKLRRLDQSCYSSLKDLIPLILDKADFVILRYKDMKDVTNECLAALLWDEVNETGKQKTQSNPELSQSLANIIAEVSSHV